MKQNSPIAKFLYREILVEISRDLVREKIKNNMYDIVNQYIVVV